MMDLLYKQKAKKSRLRRLKYIHAEFKSAIGTETCT